MRSKYIGFADWDGKNGFDFPGTYDRLELPHLIEDTQADGREVKIEIRPLRRDLGRILRLLGAEDGSLDDPC